MSYTISLFAVNKAISYNEGQYESDIFCSFNHEVLGMDADKFGVFIDRTIYFLKKHRDDIARLRSIDISVLENELDPKVYKTIIKHKITNIYELRRGVHRRHTGEISSHIVGVGKIKGKQIVKVLEAKGYMISLYVTESWD